VGAEPIIDSEVERLTSLRDHLTRAADRLRQVRIAGWTGTAADAFDAALAEICRQIYLTADQHEDAARELADYGVVHERVATLINNAFAQWPNSTAPPGVDRLHSEADDAGRRAAAHYRTAAAALDEVQRRLGELPPDLSQVAIEAATPGIGSTVEDGHADHAPERTDPITTTAPHDQGLAAMATPYLMLEPADKQALLAELRDSAHFVMLD
jgi:hypothetical protein